MARCNVKGVGLSDEHTQNYHPTLPFSSALRGIQTSLSSVIWWSVPQQSTSSYSHSRQPFSAKKSLIKLLYATCTPLLATEHIGAAEKPDFPQKLAETQSELKGK